jgi:DNA-binding IclR family transcriptional regulator
MRNTSKTPSEKIEAKHMAARKAVGVTYRELAKEHNTSKSTAHRKVNDFIRDGYNSLGSAKDE